MEMQVTRKALQNFITRGDSKNKTLLDAFEYLNDIPHDSNMNLRINLLNSIFNCDINDLSSEKLFILFLYCSSEMNLSSMHGNVHKKIEQIRIVRSVIPVSLKPIKELVEEYLYTAPPVDLQDSY